MKKIIYFITSKLGIFNGLTALKRKFDNNKKNKAFRKYGLETLRLADEAAKEAGTFLFLTFGTLLGAYREKGFIPFDNDLDVGILNRPGNLPQIMKKYGFVLKEHTYIKETGVITEEKYFYKNVQIDFFYYFEENSDLYCRIFRAHEFKLRDEANQSDGFPSVKSYVTAGDFEKKDFLGLQLCFPKNAATWLEEIYGKSFMTPIKNWSADDGYITRIEKQDQRLYRKFF